ncbi:MAG TPA: PDGLE domain-containing protein [Armatimonadota bacterium]|nr:PDGLE domain-containing protein [Armatimonadota bacterium]
MKRAAPWLLGLVAALLIAALLSPIASSWPDGLDRAAQTLGFAHREREQPVLPAPLPGYQVPQLQNPRWSTGAAGVVGTLAVFGLATLAGYLMRRRQRPGPPA